MKRVKNSRYKSELSGVIHEMAECDFKAGLISAREMREFDMDCLKTDDGGRKFAITRKKRPHSLLPTPYSLLPILCLFLFSCDLGWDLKGVAVNGNPEVFMPLGSVLNGRLGDGLSFLDEFKIETLSKRVQENVDEESGEQDITNPNLKNFLTIMLGFPEGTQAGVWNNRCAVITVGAGDEPQKINGNTEVQTFLIYYPAFKVSIIPKSNLPIDKIVMPEIIVPLPDITEMLVKSPFSIKFKNALLLTYLYTSDGISGGKIALKGGSLTILDGSDIKDNTGAFPGDMPDEAPFNYEYDLVTEAEPTTTTDITGLLNGDDGALEFTLTISDLEVDVNYSETEISLEFGIVMPLAFELADTPEHPIVNIEDDITPEGEATKSYQEVPLVQFDSMSDEVNGYLADLNKNPNADILKSLEIKIYGIKNNIFSGLHIAIAKTAEGGEKLSDWRTPIELAKGIKPDPILFEGEAFKKLPKIAIFTEGVNDFSIKPVADENSREFDFSASINARAYVDTKVDF